MFARLRRTAAVLAITLAAYAVYAVVVVPWVEPKVRLANKTRTAPPAIVRASKFNHLFPPGSWELDRPKVIETEQGTLFFDDYEPLPDRQIRLKKCTVIAQLDETPSATADSTAAGREVRPVIIRAPHGAILEFDKEFNVLHLEVGRLVGGKLSGEVSIQSPASSPTSNDALEVITKNVQIDPQKILAPHEVRFRYGPNVGSGRVLTINLASKKSSSKPGLGIGGVRSLELLHLDHLELLLDDQGLFGRQKQIAAANSDSHNPATPVEVKCRGPLRFDIVRQWMSLEDQVALVRRHPNNVNDQLNCELLQIFFANANAATSKRSASSDKPSKSSLGKLSPSRVVATGHPVIIRAAAVGVGAKAERIEYDCVLQRVWLQDREKVLLNDLQREVEAKELRYALGENNRLGDLWAQGPGIVRGEFGRDARRFDVTWQNIVQLRRVDNDPVLSFDQHATITVAGFGQFSGDTLHFYLREIPRAGVQERMDVIPDRLHMVGHVQLDTDSCHGTLREAKVWFKQPGEGNSSSAAAKRAEQPAGYLATSGSEPRPRSKYNLQADSIEAVVRMGDKPLADLIIIRGDIELREIAAAEIQPLFIRGEHFELQEGASEHPRAALLGAPAEISARGASARGPKIHLHPSDNFLEVVGAGDLSLPARRRTAHSGIGNSTPINSGIADASGDSLPTTLSWGRQMQFDGQLARFEQNVAIRGAEWGTTGEKTAFVAMGDVVHAELAQPLDFRNANLRGPMELMRAAFDGWGFLQTEMFDPAGGRKLFEQMQVLGLTVNPMSGDIHGRGPGWLRGIHRGNDLLADPATNAVAPNATTATGLNFLRVDFERELAGNLREQRIEFLNGSRTLYGRVASWEDSLDQDQVQIPAGAIRLACDRLAVARGNSGGTEAVELEAVGNVHLQGDSFVATGGRASYVRLKDQFILEGDGRNDARIEYHQQPGTRPSYVAAGKILYCPKTRQCQAINVKPSEFYDLGQLRGRGAPAIKPR